MVLVRAVFIYERGGVVLMAWRVELGFQSSTVPVSVGRHGHGYMLCRVLVYSLRLVLLNFFYVNIKNEKLYFNYFR